MTISLSAPQKRTPVCCIIAMETRWEVCNAVTRCYWLWTAVRCSCSLFTLQLWCCEQQPVTSAQAAWLPPHSAMCRKTIPPVCTRVIERNPRVAHTHPQRMLLSHLLFWLVSIQGRKLVIVASSAQSTNRGVVARLPIISWQVPNVVLNWRHFCCSVIIESTLNKQNQ